MCAEPQRDSHRVLHWHRSRTTAIRTGAYSLPDPTTGSSTRQGGVRSECRPVPSATRLVFECFELPTWPLTPRLSQSVTDASQRPCRRKWRPITLLAQSLKTLYACFLHGDLKSVARIWGHAKDIRWHLFVTPCRAALCTIQPTYPEAKWTRYNTCEFSAGS